MTHFNFSKSIQTLGYLKCLFINTRERKSSAGDYSCENSENEGVMMFWSEATKL